MIMTSQKHRSRCIVTLIAVVCIAGIAEGGRWKARRRVPTRQYSAAPIQQQGPIREQDHRPAEPELIPVEPRRAVPRRPAPSQPPRSTVRRPNEHAAATTPRPTTRPNRYGRSTITFDNQSGESALVRLAGPTRSEVSVPNRRTGTIRNVAAGHYRLFVRYKVSDGYRYIEGDHFDVQGSARTYSRITITLHGVIGGNYGSATSSAAAFAAAGSR